ncbi:hypothetical protein [Zhenpiania hominis]|uniref:Uncharacterized protein n=1 Tax=Zhenpiania hominis TaxID=2763644 RepID=A0A923NLF3_9FIRM|nr:hypothetical protein [Zhenpiania hominis]MBC6678755.1 hypothetical protein [Zhenpiania hominis]
MDLATTINIILCILSFLLAAISVIIVVLTLKQNSKMIEQSTRPYISIYGRVTNFQNPSYYLVLKNFGSSGAEIVSLDCSSNLKAYCFDEDHVPFSASAGSYVAPGQSVLSVIDSLKFTSDMEPFVFKISYRSATKTYNDEFFINPNAEICNVQTRASTKDKELKIISYTLQDLVEKHL